MPYLVLKACKKNGIEMLSTVKFSLTLNRLINSFVLLAISIDAEEMLHITAYCQSNSALFTNARL